MTRAGGTVYYVFYYPFKKVKIGQISKLNRSITAEEIETVIKSIPIKKK